MQQVSACPWQLGAPVNKPGGSHRRKGGEGQEAVVELDCSRVLEGVAPGGYAPVLLRDQLASHEREGVVGMASVQPRHKCSCRQQKTVIDAKATECICKISAAPCLTTLKFQEAMRSGCAGIVGIMSLMSSCSSLHIIMKLYDAELVRIPKRIALVFKH